MTYVALEWDHQIGKFAISWLVVQCAGIGQKCGGIQALPPRKDIAYFVNPQTAEMDAKEFANFKNITVAEDIQSFIQNNQTVKNTSQYVAFEWDHNIFNPLIKWAVLEWAQTYQKAGVRDDVAYFIDSETAENDAKSFAILREQRIKG